MTSHCLVHTQELATHHHRHHDHYLTLAVTSLQLMEMLSEKKNLGIVCWLPHGKGFFILDKKRFSNEVMPKHFKKAKFTSFTRKLNRW
jgi:hypothetical protein